MGAQSKNSGREQLQDRWIDPDCAFKMRPRDPGQHSRSAWTPGGGMLPLERFLAMRELVQEIWVESAGGALPAIVWSMEKGRASQPT